MLTQQIIRVEVTVKYAAYSQVNTLEKPRSRNLNNLVSLNIFTQNECY